MPLREKKVVAVLPAYNAEKTLQATFDDIPKDWVDEILLVDDCSRDRTVEIGKELSAKYPDVTLFSLGEPNYGKALREGILRARGEFVICDEIDLCLTDFYRTALDILERNESEMVIGSKLLIGANDDRERVAP